jgi:hypothetical protein
MAILCTMLGAKGPLFRLFERILHALFHLVSHPERLGNSSMSEALRGLFKAPCEMRAGEAGRAQIAGRSPDQHPRAIFADRELTGGRSNYAFKIACT